MIAITSIDLSTLPTSRKSPGRPSDRHILSAEPLELEDNISERRPVRARQRGVVTHSDRHG
jgi:hypothetical protein